MAIQGPERGEQSGAEDSPVFRLHELDEHSIDTPGIALEIDDDRIAKLPEFEAIMAAILPDSPEVQPMELVYPGRGRELLARLEIDERNFIRAGFLAESRPISRPRDHINRRLAAEYYGVDDPEHAEPSAILDAMNCYLRTREMLRFALEYGYDVATVRQMRAALVRQRQHTIQRPVLQLAMYDVLNHNYDEDGQEQGRNASLN